MQPVCCNSYSDRNRFWSIRVSLWQFLSDAMQCGLHALCTMCVCTVSLLLHLLCCPSVFCVLCSLLSLFCGVVQQLGIDSFACVLFHCVFICCVVP